MIGDLSKLIYFKDFQPQFKEMVGKAKKHPIIALLTQAPNNIVKEKYDSMENNPEFPELFLFKMRAFTENLIKEGVNIDAMSNQDITIFMAGKFAAWVMKEKNL